MLEPILIFLAPTVQILVEASQQSAQKDRHLLGQDEIPCLADQVENLGLPPQHDVD